MPGKLLEISLFGACAVNSAAPGAFSISGSKQKALFALLATAPFGRRSRSFLQECLWGQACYDTGRQSLRRALADIKAAMGDNYALALYSTNSEITLDLSKVQFVGGPSVGLFLEGLDVRERGYIQWLEGIRGNPNQLAGLYSLVSGIPRLAAMPVVAVIPFRAVSHNSLDVALGDWLAEETCRSLSRSRLIAVISHLSCRELAKGIVDIRSIREQLKADFCVSGSLRNVGGKIFVDADFVDTGSGRIIWTRQFSGRSDDFLAHAGEGISQIVNAVGSAIADEAVKHVRAQPLCEIEDHRLLVAGVNLMHRSTLRDFAQAKLLVDEAVQRAPFAAETHAWLAKWHALSVMNRWSTDADTDITKAKDSNARALDLSPDSAFALTMDGFVQCNLLRRLDIAEERYSQALNENPSESLSWLLKAALHTFRYEGDSAVSAAEKARGLSPIDPFGYFYDALTAGALLTSGNYERALELADRSIRTNDRHLSTLRIKIFALTFLDRIGEAKHIGAQLMIRDPSFTVAGYMKSHPCADYAMGKMVEQALRTAGIP